MQLLSCRYPTWDGMVYLGLWGGSLLYFHLQDTGSWQRQTKDFGGAFLIAFSTRDFAGEQQNYDSGASFPLPMNPEVPVAQFT